MNRSLPPKARRGRIEHVTVSRADGQVQASTARAQDRGVDDHGVVVVVRGTRRGAGLSVAIHVTLGLARAEASHR
jgi:hypothetical protein